jgi:hypothetical protein
MFSSQSPSMNRTLAFSTNIFFLSLSGIPPKFRSGCDKAKYCHNQLEE